MATSLDDVLSDKPEKPAEKPVQTELAIEDTAPAKEEAKVERSTSLRKEHLKKEYIAQGRDPETGQFVPAKEEPTKAAPEKAAPAPEKAPEKPAAPPAQELTEKERAAFAAAASERRKRQDLERQLAEVRKTQQPITEQAKAFWDDPEAHFKTAEERMQQIARETHLKTAEMLARARYKDFDDKIAAFAEIVQQTPGLAHQWLADADPAEFAYRLGKNHIDLQQAGSLDKLRAEIETKARADERTKVEAEFKAKQEAAAKQRAELPPTLSDVRGAAMQHTPVWTGPTPLSDVLKP